MILSFLFLLPLFGSAGFEAADDAPATSTYEVGSKGFSIVVPATWERVESRTVSDPRNQELILGPAGPSGVRPQLLIWERWDQFGSEAALLEETEDLREHFRTRGAEFEQEPAPMNQGSRIFVTDRFVIPSERGPLRHVSMLYSLDGHCYQLMGWGAAKDSDWLPTVLRAFASFRPQVDSGLWSLANRVDPVWVPIGEGEDRAVLRFDVRGALFSRYDEDPGSFRALDWSKNIDVLPEEDVDEPSEIVDDWLEYWREEDDYEPTVLSRKSGEVAGCRAEIAELKDRFHLTTLIGVQVREGLGAAVMYRHPPHRDVDRRDYDLLLNSLRVLTPEEAEADRKKWEASRRPSSATSTTSRPTSQ